MCCKGGNIEWVIRSASKPFGSWRCFRVKSLIWVIPIWVKRIGQTLEQDWPAHQLRKCILFRGMRNGAHQLYFLLFENRYFISVCITESERNWESGWRFMFCWCSGYEKRKKHHSVVKYNIIIGTLLSLSHTGQSNYKFFRSWSTVIQQELIQWSMYNRRDFINENLYSAVADIL